MRLAIVALLLLVAAPVQAQVSLDRELVQGGLAIGRVSPGSTVTFEGRRMRVAADGTFVIGVGRDVGPSVTLEVIATGGARESRTLPVGKRRFDIQRIDGLPERQVSPSPEDAARIRDENAQVAAARTRDIAETLFKSGFVWPVIGPVSGVYGSQRILNGQARAPHWGVDIAMPTGTPVVATADGVVTLAHPDMFLTGQTLLLDHGHGLNSLYMHLSEIAVRPGERVKQGQVIGKVGATGRVTGAHLHWGMNLFDIRLDPALLVPPMPKTGG